MKKINLTKIFVLLLSINFFFSCESPDMGEPSQQENGLLSFSVSIPGEATEFRATVSGPYQDGEKIYIKVPTTEENPLDITKLKPYASVENNCYVSPALPGLADFTEPFPVTVIDAKGVSRTNYVIVEPTLQKTTFRKLWFKNATEMALIAPNYSGLTVVGDNLLVHDGGNENPIKVYDRISGEFKKSITKPTTFTMQVKADDGGHFVVNRYNIYGAGFMVYFYETIESTPELILNYTAGAGCPVNLGTKMSVTGNLKEGKAYIYATTDDMNYYYWEFDDGVLLSSEPTVVRYGNAGSNWTYASVKRKSIDANSDHYITYCHYDGNDSGSLLKGSRFEVFPSDLNVVQMDRSNHYYKILDFDTFVVNGDEFLAIVHQGFWAWDAAYLRVFEITDRNKFSLKQGDADYDKFVLLESDYYGGTNYNRWGDVATVVDGLDVYIYTAIVAGDASAAGVLAYKMTYTPQE